MKLYIVSCFISKIRFIGAVYTNDRFNVFSKLIKDAIKNLANKKKQTIIQWNDVRIQIVQNMSIFWKERYVFE